MNDNTQLKANNKLNQLKQKLETLENSPIDGDSKQIKKHNQNINYCRQEIANLKAFLSFTVGQRVTNGTQIGEIGALTLSPGGMPEVWVSWSPGSAPIPEQPARLKLVDEATELSLNPNSKDNQGDFLPSITSNNDSTISDKISTANVEYSPEELEPKDSSTNEGKDDNTHVINKESEPLKEDPSNNQLE